MMQEQKQDDLNRITVPPYLHDYGKFLSSFNLLELFGADGVLYIGGTGSGKSLAIGVQLGARYEVDDETGHYVATNQTHPNQYPRVGDSWSSETFDVKGWFNEEEGVLHIDTAGFGDTRGDQALKWTQYCLRLLFSTVNSFRAITVVVKHSDLERNIVDGFDQLADKLDEFSFGLRNFYHSMVFLLTKVRQNVQKRHIVNDLRQAREEAITEANAIVTGLSNDYPRNFVGRTAIGGGRRIHEGYDWLANTWRGFQMGVGLSDDPRLQEFGELGFETEGINFDRAEVNEPQRQGGNRLEQFNKLIKRIKLFNAMLAGDGDRLVISSVNGPEECEQTRRELSEAISNVPGMSRQLLQQINREKVCDEGFELQNLACSLMDIYLPKLSHILPILQRYVEVFRASRTLREGIDGGNWRRVQSSQIGSLRDRLNALRHNVEEYQHEIRSLNVNMEDSFLRNKPLSGKFPWYAKVFGWLYHPTVEASFTYPDEQASQETDSNGEVIRFSRISLDPPLDSGRYDIIGDAPDFNAGGRSMSIMLRSRWPHDLNNVRVRLHAEKCFTPGTRNTIRFLTNEIERLNSEREHIELLLANIRGAATAEQLKHCIDPELDSLRSQLANLSLSLAAPYSGEFHSTHYPVIKGILAFIELLKRARMQNKDVASDQGQLIEYFCRCDKEIRELLDDEIRMDLSQHVPSFHYGLDKPPIERMRVLEMPPEPQNGFIYKKLKAIRSPLGFSMMLTSIVIFIELANMHLNKLLSIINLVALTMFFIGVYLVCSMLKEYAANLTFTIGAVLEQASEAADTGAREVLVLSMAAQRAAEGLVGAVQDMSRRPLVDVNVGGVDISLGSAFSLFGGVLLRNIFGSSNEHISNLGRA